MARPAIRAPLRARAPSSERDARREGHGLPLQVRAVRPCLGSDEAAASVRWLQVSLLEHQAQGVPVIENNDGGALCPSLSQAAANEGGQRDQVKPSGQAQPIADADAAPTFEASR